MAPSEGLPLCQGGGAQLSQAAAEKLDAELAKRTGAALLDGCEGTLSLMVHQTHRGRQLLHEALESVLQRHYEEWQRALSLHMHLVEAALQAGDGLPTSSPGTSASCVSRHAPLTSIPASQPSHQVEPQATVRSLVGQSSGDQVAAFEAMPSRQEEASWEKQFRRALRQDVREAVVEGLREAVPDGRARQNARLSARLSAPPDQKDSPAAAELPLRSSSAWSDNEQTGYDWRRNASSLAAGSPNGSTAIHLRFIARSLQWHLPGCCKGVGNVLVTAFDALASTLREPEPKRVGALAHALQSGWFETLTLMLILCAVVFSAVSLDVELKHVREETVAPMTTMAVVETAFVVCFAVELTLKLKLHGKFFFFNEDASWNIFDVVLVTLGVVEVSISWYLVLGDQDEHDRATSVVFLRFVRFGKVVRILRALKAIKFMEELRLMIDCLLWSAASVFWMLLLVFATVIIFALITMSVIVSHVKVNPESIEDIDGQFGSVLKAVLTLLQACSGGADWGDIYEDIYQIDQPLSVVFLFFIMFFQLVLLNVVTSMFLDRVMKLAQPSADTIVQEKSQLEVKDMHALKELFREMDSDRDGEISMEEFLRALDSHHELGVLLATCGVDIKDAQAFFKVVSQRQRSMPGEELRVTIEDIVANCSNLRGFATAVDLQIFRSELNRKLKSIKEAIAGLSSL